MSSEIQSNRRDFLKTAAAGAVVLGAESKIAVAKTVTVKADASKVILTQDDAVRKPDNSIDEQRLAKMLDKSMFALTSATVVAEAWKHIVSAGQRISIKVNTIAGPGLSPHVALVNLVCERLQQAGIKPGDIIIWDRTNRELQRAGFTISTDPSRVRCFGTDTPGFGYEEAVESYGSVKTQFSKILMQHSDGMINMALLKDHVGAGVTVSMKNMYGVINNPRDQHAKSGNPHVADLNAMPAIRSKMKLTIVDGLTGVYDGGPSFHPEHAWNFNGLLVSQDPVALDLTAWQIIDRARVQHGLQTLAATGRPPLYIATAADGSHKLGTDDPKRIALLQV